MAFYILCVLGIPLGILLDDPSSPESAFATAFVLFIVSVYPPAFMFALYFAVIAGPLFFVEPDAPITMIIWVNSIVFLAYRIWLKKSDKEDPLYYLKDSLGWLGWLVQAWGVSFAIANEYQPQPGINLILLISIPAALAATYYFLDCFVKYRTASKDILEEADKRAKEAPYIELNKRISQCRNLLNSKGYKLIQKRNDWIVKEPLGGIMPIGTIDELEQYAKSKQ